MSLFKRKPKKDGQELLAALLEAAETPTTEGMLADVPNETGTIRQMSVTFNGSVMSHQWPVERFIHLLDIDGECLCGPDVEMAVVADGTIVGQCVHHPLEMDQYGWMGVY